MTLAELKRIKPGTKIIRVYNKLREIKPELREGTITKVQSNGLYIDKRFLDFPPASLLEFDGQTIKIYEPGCRPLNEDEKRILANCPHDPKQEEIDMLTDGSQMYWRKKRYFHEQDADWYWGKWHKGKRYSYNDGGKMYDRSMRGELSLVYEIKGG